MKRKLFTLLMLLVSVFAIVMISNTSTEAATANEEVKALFEEYYNKGTYTKDTVINLTEKAQEDLTIKGYFHAGVNLLKRTTYYKGDSLWMSNHLNGYSYYGTHYNGEEADGVTNAHTSEPLVQPENPSVVLSGEGKNSMEEYYTTLADLIANEATWTANGTEYSTDDETVKGYFLDFTAPCLYANENGKVGTKNYFTFTKAVVKTVDHNLVLELYVSSTDFAAVSGGVEGEENVLSTATIKPSHIHDYAIAKSDSNNHWNECSCGEKADLETHTPGVSASWTSAQICTKCNYELNSKVTSVTIYYYNSKGWSTVNLYAWIVDPIASWPGSAMNVASEVGSNWYSLEVKADSLEGLKIIFNNGSAQTGDISVVEGKYYYYGTNTTGYATASEVEEAVANEQQPSGVTLYLKPNSNWKQSSAWFAVYYWGASGSQWAKMTDSDGDGIYEVTINDPSDCSSGIIFCRMNSSKTNLGWDSKWDQTVDLKYDGTKNLFTVNANAWNNANGTWSVK